MLGLSGFLACAALLGSTPATPDDPSPAVDGGGDDRGDDGRAWLDDALAPSWLDPAGPAWEPRRGARFEIAGFLGVETAYVDLDGENPPSIDGIVLTGVVRHYPVDRLAVVLGVRSYGAVDGVPAAGTNASSVTSIITGARYDLVRENRFSLLWDVYSGPSFFAFAALPEAVPDVLETTYAVGGEMGTALALRYSIGPWTGELRGVVGGRAGAGATPFGRAADGPFSVVYAGLDIGLTWSSG